MRQFSDSAWKQVILVCGASSIVILLLIIIFTLREGLPAFTEIGFFKFISGTTWKVANDDYGILSFIVGSIYVTALALVMSVPLGVFCAIFLAEVAPNWMRQIVRPAVELLVGIPSVVYGLVGLLLLVPQISKLGGSGDSILAAAIVLTVMVLPTIISVSEDSIRSVPRVYKEGSLALGATQWQTIWHVMLPAARSGILAAVVLGMGRAIGETMAMIMVIGNSIKIPVSPLDPARTMTGSLALEINYATGLHWNALFACGVVLLIFILALNSIAMVLRGRTQQ
ncbi:MAG TPA: phosphate ABC transporter permease subunit PstC [Dehalococcoidia bacterium]|nr:phosphate ABC transporter permease subunit PstC [Dehalococcoidia bacterium]